ncbi:MAG: hypothetical protein WCG07_00840 [Candidatus Taylorbacteria bacterium]
MLSLFPSFFTYEHFGPFIIRIVLGITLAYFGYKKVVHQGHSSGSNSKIYGAVEVFIALFLIIGLYTQLAALMNAIILIIKLGFKARDKALFTNGINYYILLLAMALSLIVTGGGAWGFDLLL